jgi:hypothetical protein
MLGGVGEREVLDICHWSKSQSAHYTGSIKTPVSFSCSAKNAGNNRIRERAVSDTHTTDHTPIDPSVPPSGVGCVECESDGSWWLHLRRCAACGHIGCCESSPSQHASIHAQTPGHPVIQSFEPGENWFWDYTSSEYLDGPELAAPHSHPESQPTPGPAGRVPENWQELLN